MSDIFTMDEPQPRLLDETGQGILGTPMDRPDGKLKVTGRAEYAADAVPEGAAWGVLLRATISRGRVAGFDRDSVAGIDGFLDIVTDERLLRNPAQGQANEAPIQPGAEVHYHGQPIALVVAESFEAARDAAARLVVRYDVEDGVGTSPEHPMETEVDEPETAGDFDAGWDAAEVTLDLTYETPAQVSAAMEPHAAVAWWEGDRVTVRSALQMLRFNKNELSDSLGLDPENVRILAPFVGGGFGSKLGIGSEAVAAAVASERLGRPVAVVLPRQTVFDAVLRRTETRQRLRLGARRDGTLTALAHDDWVSQLDGEDNTEPTAQATKFLWGAEAMHFQQTVRRASMTPAGAVRAPGEAVGMVALEAAMDELAVALEMDPVALRLKNIPEKHPMEDIPYSARRLADCLKEGARRFGWADKPARGTVSEGDWRIGWGMAAAARSNMLVRAAARVRLQGDCAVVETDMTDIGTGSYAILTQIAAEMLGLDPAHVKVELGDSDLPGASGSGGSFGASSAGSAVFLAAKTLRARIAEAMGCAADDLTLKDGVARCANRERPLAELIPDELVAEATIKPGETEETHFSAGFGAHFAEVAVNRWTGEVRVRRFESTVAMGRVLNEKTSKSQVIGGVIWGIGTALTEEQQHDPRTGHVVTRDLANYHVPAHLDVPGQIAVEILEERDDHANPMQSKGVGELGISGAGAAILNAIYDATGARLREMPATPDRVIAAMEAAEGE